MSKCSVTCTFPFFYPVEILAESVRMFETHLASSHVAEVRAVCYGVCFYLPFGRHSTHIRLLHLRSISHTWLGTHHTCR